MMHVEVAAFVDFRTRFYVLKFKFIRKFTSTA
jgi:hypothetical protein